MPQLLRYRTSIPANFQNLLAKESWALSHKRRPKKTERSTGAAQQRPCLKRWLGRHFLAEREEGLFS